jgi:hypothetical protein
MDPTLLKFEVNILQITTSSMGYVLFMITRAVKTSAVPGDNPSDSAAVAPGPNFNPYGGEEHDGYVDYYDDTESLTTYRTFSTSDSDAEFEGFT